MTEEELKYLIYQNGTKKNFEEMMKNREQKFYNRLKKYNPEQEEVYVFEESDLKIAYLQGCSDEVENWEKKRLALLTQLSQTKILLRKVCEGYASINISEKEMCDRVAEAEQFLKEADNDRKAD